MENISLKLTDKYISGLRATVEDQGIQRSHTDQDNVAPCKEPGWGAPPTARCIFQVAAHHAT